MKISHLLVLTYMTFSLVKGYKLKMLIAGN